MLTQRSTAKELIDLGPEYYTPQEYKDCMQKLFRVNRILGFFRDTVQFISRLPAYHSLLDIGCGDGLFLLHLCQYFPHMQFLGTDINAEAIALANQRIIMENKRISVSFQKHKPLPPKSFDVVLATLVCHHMTDHELVAFIREACLIARKKVILNDLHRHLFAYILYRIISPLFFRNRLITHDGAISILRGFTRREWQKLLNAAGVKNYEIQWRFPFRWRIILCSE